jgi:hypothetical protein
MWVLIPNPGGQKLPTKKENMKNFIVFKFWMFSLEGWRLSMYLEHPSMTSRDKKMKFWIKIGIFSTVNFTIFDHQIP